MAVAETVVPRFEMGRVLKRTFGAIAQNPITFCILSLVVGIPILAVDLAFNPYTSGASVENPFSPAILRYSALFWVVYMLGTFVLQAGIAVGITSYLNGRTASLAECLSAGVSFVPQFALMTVLMLPAFIIAFVLLIVPAIILMMMWFVAAPACVVEHAGVLPSLSRSRALTKGYRWRIFGLYLLFFLFAIAIAVISAVTTGTTLFPASQEAAIAAAANRTVAQLAASIIATMISAVLIGTLVAAVYYELRQLKDGVGPEALATVFD
jgi:uncharacterized membrane protein